MEEVQLFQFQKNCDAILETVIQTNKPVLITDKGKLMVKIVPISSSEQGSWLGCLSGTGQIIGDIISPVEALSIWEVLAE